MSTSLLTTSSAAVSPAFVHTSGPGRDEDDWLRRLPRSFVTYLDEPLSQRPPGSAGKRGVCTLAFTVAQGRTQLGRSFVTHPFHLTAPWHLDPALPGMAVVYLQTPAGGLIQGDRARMQFTLAPHAQVHLTTQAAEKIHSMSANCAMQQASFSVGADAALEYCPEPVILFPGARFVQDLDVTLEEGAYFFLSEIFLSHPAVDGTPFEALAATLRIRDVADGLLVHDRSFVWPRQQHLAGPGILGGYHAWGMAFLVGPAISQDWVREVHRLISAESDVIAGATALPKERGVCVKAVGEVRALRRVLHVAWDYLRARLLGAPAPVFPK
jgi:urease accessory protein